ncbi:CBS domain-containing protein [Streptomyces tropicalis]|uniref:CBS domain-containing protein n=1 Tax=Streptomyces tropicalis TaxID=3034234 RepID=A0ABT6AAP1_9ACTN|nr:CBS domain-containing protein [Streptomyces tropicalis]MDF3301507.1 CBS domain-containing protein [Streptomyces tropicalis]
MQHRVVEDLMTRGVVRVGRDTPFKRIAQLLADNGVTAVPVIDDTGRPVGVVSEADLLSQVAAQPDPAGLLPPPDAAGRGPARVDGATAEELMSAPAVCARPEWTVVEAARLMEAHRVKRLPVVDEAGVLVGIVSRGDLLRIFLRRDEAIREEISGDVLGRTLGLTSADVTVSVADGRVVLEGVVGTRSVVPVIERLCRGVDGVVSVASDIVYHADDTTHSVGAG